MKRILIACVAACFATSALAQALPQTTVSTVQAPAAERVLYGRLGQEINTSLRCSVDLLTTQEQMAALQHQLDDARAELKKLKDAAMPKDNEPQKAQ